MRPSMRHRLQCAVGVLLVGMSTGAVLEFCENTGLLDVMFFTLVASKTNPATEGWIIHSACQILQRSGLKPGGSFELNAVGIFQVLSVPTEATSISLVGCDLSRGADFSMANNAQTLSLSAAPVDPRKFLLPPSLDTITFENSNSFQLTSLNGVRFPNTLKHIIIKSSGLTSLGNVQFPSSLQALHISSTPLSAFDAQLPSGLRQLSFNDISLGSIDQVTLPSGLESFTLKNGGTLSIRGVDWPATIKKFDFSQTVINAFEIRRSDVAIFSRLMNAGTFSATVTQATCRSGTILEPIGSVKFCVVSNDADSNQLAPSTSTKTQRPTTLNGSNGGASTSSENEESDGGGASGGGDKVSSKTDNRDPAQSTLTGSSVSDQPDAMSDELAADSAGAPTSESNRSSSAARGRPQDTPPNSIVAGSKLTLEPTVKIILIVLGCLLTLVAGFVTYRVFVNREKRREDGSNHRTMAGKYTRSDTPTTSSQNAASHEPKAPSLVEENLSIDFRDDKELLRSRINGVIAGKRIARGGYGIVYRGSYQGRVVAIKQMLPDAWRNGAMIAAFVDELRLCARLDHSKIVEFIGVSWTGVRDLSAVSEFMAGGDLHAVLHKYPESTGREWTGPWTTSNLRNKTLIATDVAEAIVYLHSFETPIIHRDLKTKNVLLDLVGNAKLSDFGISREMTVDETMTSEVGTAAWIAPEVLRGERYSEKADIYSLGVLLVELDRCSHPYANESALVSSSSSHGEPTHLANSSHVAHRNTQIAILVSTGKLKPTPTLACPLYVAALVSRCLSFAARDRPAAVEVLHELRRIRESQQTPATIEA